MLLEERWFCFVRVPFDFKGRKVVVKEAFFSDFLNLLQNA